MKYAILFLLLTGATSAFAGPIFPGRSFIYAPEFRSPLDTTKGVAFLRQQGIWGDLTHGFNSAGDRYYTSIATGGIVQFAEWQHSAIYLVGDYELVADQHSDIYFHPRGVFWTEGVLYMDKIGETELHAGYINRCHHDVDDLENNIVGAGEERTLIYSSFLANFVWRDVMLGPMRSDLWTQFDYYVFHHEYLTPETTPISSTNYERLAASVSAGAKIDLFSLGDAITYFRTAESASLYKNASTIDARAEIGMQFLGAGAAMNVFLGAEFLQDDATRPVPVNSKFAYLGFRFLGRNIGL